MNRFRYILVSVLITAPVIVLVAAGAYSLWHSRWFVWLWWSFPVCWTIAYVVLRIRPRRVARETAQDKRLPAHWTPRDEAAYAIVRDEQDTASEIAVAQLSDPHFYLQSALDLSTKIAQHYHPKSSDPISSLTVIDILAAAQLAVEETSTWMHENVPGSHLLTLNHWRALSRAPRWVGLVSDASWLISLLWNPVNLPRWLATKFATSSTTQEIEAGLLTAVYRAFLHNVGLYCIEMNSGRLRGGVVLYREAIGELQKPRGDARPSAEMARDSAAAKSRAASSDRTITDGIVGQPGPMPTSVVRFAIVGQVSAGKSSLINAILGEHRAACDVLATTDSIQRYRYTVPTTGEQCELLDTPGYGSAELSNDQRKAIEAAWLKADLVLLVMDVTSPARQADWHVIHKLVTWYVSRAHLKPPPIIGVLTHIDGLSPPLEWQPPYDWREPTQAKEENIRAAVEYTEQVFADYLVAVVPICSDSSHHRVYGIQEWLMPAIVASLTEAKGSLVIRTLHQNVDAERLGQLLRQFRTAGMKVLKSLLD